VRCGAWELPLVSCLQLDRLFAGGTLAAILASAAGGAAAAGIAGALVGLGIPEDEAKHYDSEFQAGRTIVTVKAPLKPICPSD